MGNFAENLNLGNRFLPPPPDIILNLPNVCQNDIYRKKKWFLVTQLVRNRFLRCGSMFTTHKHYLVKY